MQPSAKAEGKSEGKGGGKSAGERVGNTVGMQPLRTVGGSRWCGCGGPRASARGILRRGEIRWGMRRTGRACGARVGVGRLGRI